MRGLIIIPCIAWALIGAAIYCYRSSTDDQVVKTVLVQTSIDAISPATRPITTAYQQDTKTLPTWTNVTMSPVTIPSMGQVEIGVLKPGQMSRLCPTGVNAYTLDEYGWRPLPTLSSAASLQVSLPQDSHDEGAYFFYSQGHGLDYAVGYLSQRGAKAVMVPAYDNTVLSRLLIEKSWIYIREP